MGFPDGGKCYEQTEANNSTNLCPLGSEAMVDKSFNEIYCLSKPNQNACFLTPDELLLGQLSDPQSRTPAFKNPFAVPDTENQLPRCEADRQEKRGALDVTVNKQGELTSVSRRPGDVFYKMPDGKWVEKNAPYSDTIVENLKVDRDGNLEYDYNNDEKNVHVHHKHNADGSYSFDSAADGRFIYDKDNNLLESPSGEGHVRKYHYTNGQLDQIDGNLGHWERAEKDGQVAWVNKNTGAVWEGEMHVNIATNFLEYRGRNGTAWNFTTWGTDLRP